MSVREVQVAPGDGDTTTFEVVRCWTGGLCIEELLRNGRGSACHEKEEGYRQGK